MQSALEESLAAKAEMLEAGIAAAKEGCAALATELKTAEGRMQSAQDALGEQLAAQGTRLEEKLTAEAKGMVDREASRIGDLESVIKQYDYERLMAAQRLGVDLNNLRAELAPLKQWATEQIAEQLEKGLSAKASEINATLAMLNERMDTEVQMLSTRLGATESDSISLRVAIDNATQQ